MASGRIKVGMTVEYNDQPHKVLGRIRGAEKVSANMHSGVMFTGFHRKESYYQLEGISEPVKSSKLKTPR